MIIYASCGLLQPPFGLAATCRSPFPLPYLHQTNLTTKTGTAMPAWTDPQSWLSSLMGPSPFAIAITFIIALAIPLVLHLAIYRSASSTTLPSFLLIGPSGAGKTALLTLVYFHPFWGHDSELTVVVRARPPCRYQNLASSPLCRSLPSNCN